MLTIRLDTYDGQQYELPMLLEWELTYTGSVPCDSMAVTCLYDEGMADVLPKATRFSALKGGGMMLRGVVDAYEISLSSKGLLVTVEGRGMAAILLDNESEAVTYSRAILGEILVNHVQPYGISVDAQRQLDGIPYAVSSGSSQWKALWGYTHRSGGFEPYFLRDGTLVVAPLWGSGRTLRVNDNTPILSLRKREQRYGVISEVLIQDKARGYATASSTGNLPQKADSAARCCTCPAALPDSAATPGNIRSPSRPWSRWRSRWSSPSLSPPFPATGYPCPYPGWAWQAPMRWWKPAAGWTARASARK